MNIFNKLSAAIFGEFLLKLLYIPEVLILAPIGFYQLFQKFLPQGMFGNILSGFLAASLYLLSLASCVWNPFALLGAGLGFLISHTIHYGFKGALIGWDNGFAGVFKYCADKVNFVISVVTGRPYYELPAQNPAAWDNVFFTNGMLHLFTPFQRALKGIDSLMLPQDEFDTLNNSQEPSLNTEELNTLESLSDVNVKKNLENYKILFNRLEIEGVCCFLQDKPSSENALLLVKLYKKDDVWLPVPKRSNVYDKSQLTQWLNQHYTDPLTRESIEEPSLYEGHDTRYVCHPYYHSTSNTTGVSQELSEYIKVLRAYLPKNLQQVSQEDARREMIAARLRHFAPASSSEAVTNTNDAQMNAQQNCIIQGDRHSPWIRY